MMRSRTELRGIAKRLADSPTEQDIADAQQAIFDLLAERSRLSQRVNRLRSPKKAPEPKPRKPRRSLMEILRNAISRPSKQ
jgi:hypothetical protein